MTRETGQSSVEFGIGLATLSLLAVSTLVIDTWQEAQRRVLLAARQSAFEHHWSGNRDDQPQHDRVYDQYFGDAGLAAPLTGSRLASTRDVGMQALSQPLQGVAGSAEALLLQTLEAGSALGAGGFNPGGRGWKGARVLLDSRAMDGLPAPFDGLGPRLEGSLLLLDDGWAASGPSQVVQRVGALVPTRALASLHAVVRPLLLPLSLLEPSLARFCPGLIDPEGVPDDRLSPARSGQPSWNSCR